MSKDFQDYLKDLEKVQCGLLEPSTALETILSSTMSMTYLQNKPVITNYITKEVEEEEARHLREDEGPDPRRE